MWRSQLPSISGKDCWRGARPGLHRNRVPTQVECGRDPHYVEGHILKSYTEQHPAVSVPRDATELSLLVLTMTLETSHVAVVSCNPKPVTICMIFLFLTGAESIVQLWRISARKGGGIMKFHFPSIPIDVVKTTVMNMKVAAGEAPPYRGALDCAVKTVRAEGPMVLYKGFVFNGDSSRPLLHCSVPVSGADQKGDRGLTQPMTKGALVLQFSISDIVTQIV